MLSIYNADDQTAIIVMAIQQNFATCFHDTDNPTTICGHSGKLSHMLSTILMIQRPYMIDVTYYLRDFRFAQELVRFGVHFLSFILIK